MSGRSADVPAVSRRWRRPVRDLRPILGYPLLPLTVLVAAGVTPWDQPGVEVLAVAVILAGGLLLVWRMIRLGLYVSDAGVRVIRLFSSEVVRWDRLAGVEVDELGRPEIVLRTSDGDRVRTAVFRGRFSDRSTVVLSPKSFDAMVAALRRWQRAAARRHTTGGRPRQG